MAKVKTIEKRIWDIERFDVRILRLNGQDVRGDLSNLPTFPSYSKASKNSLTVEKWKENRFRANYPGFDVEVLDGNGERCPGNTVLATVRGSYF